MKRSTLIVLALFLQPVFISAAIPADERAALLALYNQTGGAGWTQRTGWNGAAGTEGGWFGVTLDAAGEHAVRLDLAYNGLSGTLPEELGGLRQLQVLNLSSNQLSGSLPVRLGELAALEEMNLSFNGLSGPLPAGMEGMTALQVLDLSSNQLTGSLPGALTGLAQLEQLKLSRNRFEGSIPEPAAGQWGALTVLELGYNRLNQSSVPSWILQRTSWTALDLAECNIRGGLPAEISGMLQLNHLNLSNNQFSGPLPADLGLLPGLLSLYLAGNAFTGEIPVSFRFLNKLLFLSLDGNRLSGEIPAELGELAKLQALWLSGNRLEGSLPSALGQLTALRVLALNGNRFSGEIPSTLTQLVNLDRLGKGLNLHYNALTTGNEALRAFINARHAGGDFELTQTTAPATVYQFPPYAGAAVLTWAPMTYLSDPGFYEVIRLNPQTQGWDVLARTASKDELSQVLASPAATPLETCSLRAVTLPHARNQNTVYGEPVAAAAPPAPARTSDVLSKVMPVSQFYLNGTSQVLPATWLTFRIDPAAFPAASAANPAVIQIHLPPGAVLSQTLADGTAATAAPEPIAGEKVVDIAVCEFGAGGRREPVPPDLFRVSPRAVQILRYVAGETTMYVRINESTTNWIPSTVNHFIGFTLGFGPGLRPNLEENNWGRDGLQQQESLMFFADLRNYSFADFSQTFPVAFSSFYQHDCLPTSTGANPSNLSLFTAANTPADLLNAMTAQVGNLIVSHVMADVNRDGLDDFVSVSAKTSRVYWAPGRPDGSFDGLDWIDLEGYEPKLIAAGDVTGLDGKPDLLVVDSTGNLHLLDWNDLFGSGAVYKNPAAVELPLAISATSAILYDLTGDGQPELLLTDATNNQLVVINTGDYSQTAYPTGTAPAAVTCGDFDGDGDTDAATANQTQDSISVFLNDGTGNLSGTQVTGVGREPYRISAVDLDRNGRDDLVFILKAGRAVLALRSGAGGTFSMAGSQRMAMDYNPVSLATGNFNGMNGPDVLVGFSSYNKFLLFPGSDTGTLGTFSRINVLPNVYPDPESAVIRNEDQVLAANAGTVYGGWAGTAGVAGVMPPSLQTGYYPQSASLSFSIVNLSGFPANLNLELMSDEGRHQSFTSATVADGNQYARFAADLLGPGANAPGCWAKMTADQTRAYGLWMINGGSNLAYLDGTRVPAVSDARTDSIFPVFLPGEGKLNQIVLINPRRDGSRVLLSAWSAAGQLKQAEVFPVPGEGRQVVDLETVFNGLTEGDHLSMSASSPLIGYQLFGDGQTLACLEGLPAGGSRTVLYSPHLAVGNFGMVEYWSGLDLVNPAGQFADVAISWLDDTGLRVYPVQFMSIPPRGKIHLDLATAFDHGGPGSGYLKIDGQGTAGLTGSITIGGLAAGSFLSCLPLLAESHQDYLLGHIANGTLNQIDFFTGVSILNTGGTTSTATISAFNQTGQLQQTASAVIPPGERKVFLLNGLMPDLPGLFGGYILIAGSPGSELMVFELFGNNQLNFLSAVPAIPLPPPPVY